MKWSFLYNCPLISTKPPLIPGLNHSCIWSLPPDSTMVRLRLKRVATQSSCPTELDMYNDGLVWFGLNYDSNYTHLKSVLWVLRSSRRLHIGTFLQNKPLQNSILIGCNLWIRRDRCKTAIEVLSVGCLFETVLALPEGVRSTVSANRNTCLCQRSLCNTIWILLMINK